MATTSVLALYQTIRTPFGSIEAQPGDTVTRDDEFGLVTSIEQTSVVSGKGGAKVDITWPQIPVGP